MSESPNRRGQSVGLNTHDLALIGLRDLVVLLIVVIGRSTHRHAVIAIYIAPGEVFVLTPVVRRRKRPDQGNRLGDVAEGTLHDVHRVPFAPILDNRVIAQRRIPGASKIGEQRAVCNLQAGNIPHIPTRVVYVDVNIIAASRDASISNQEAIWKGRRSGRTPLPANLTSLRVIPATSQSFVENDNEHIVAERRTAFRN